VASIRTRRRADGSRVYQVRGPGIRTRSFTRKADAELYELEQERKRRLGALYQAPPERFGAFLEAYMSRRETQLRPSSIDGMRRSARHLEPLADLQLRAVSRAELEDLTVALARRAPRQAQKTLALAKATLRAARGRGHEIDDAVFSIRPPRYDEREPRFLTLDELNLLASWTLEHVRRLVLVAGLTGMRQGELFALEDSDLDLDAGTLWVRRGKTKAARRRVYLAAEVVALLREQLVARAPKTRLVFPTSTGGRWQRHNFMHRAFKPAREAAGIPDVTFHDLRHTAVSLMAVAGWRPEHIAKQIGHADGGALIFRRYRHLFADELESQARLLDSLVRGNRDRGEQLHLS
jgi:integrase